MDPSVPIVLKTLGVGLGGGLAAALTLVALHHLFLLTVRPSARQEAGSTVLEYSRVFKIVCVFSVIAMGLMVLVLVLMTPERPPLVGEVSLGFLMFAVLRENSYVIRYNPDGLHVMDPWRRRRFVPWSAVQFVASVRGFGYLLFTDSHGNIRVPSGFSGVQSLLQELCARGLSPSPLVTRTKAYSMRRQQRRAREAAAAK